MTVNSGETTYRYIIEFALVVLSQNLSFFPSLQEYVSPTWGEIIPVK